MRVAMVLAAGLGTRLRPLTDELPKPLVPVGDRTMLSHVLARLAGGGVERAVVNTHHLPAAFGPRVLAGMPIPALVIHEPEILGTAGGVANAAGALGEGDVAVWNGDILADVDVSVLFAARVAGTAAVLAFAPRPRGEGLLGVGDAGEVVRLRSERFGEESKGGDFLGIQVISYELRATLPASGCLVGDVYIPALGRGARIAALPMEGSWQDVGTIEAYLEANRRWLAERGLTHHIGAGATVAPGIDPSGSVVGAGAAVTGRGELRDCVVWPGAHVEAPLARAVATPRGVTRPRATPG